MKKRLIVVALGLFFLFAILIIRFFRIQILEGENWSKVARRQHYFVVQEPAKRGTFYSNTAIKKGHPETPQKLVIDIEKFHLFVDPESIPIRLKERLSKQLAQFLHTDAAWVRGQLELKTRNRRLALWLEKEEQEAIINWWQPFARRHHIPRNALYFVSDYQRSYPFGRLLGAVLHTVQRMKDEKTGQYIPTGGLELFCNNYLTGKPGKRRLMRSPRNSLETGEVITKPENGADIYLTINHCLQAIAEEEIEKGVKKYRAKSGWAILMDPWTGEVLALAQYPDFFPEDYQRYFNDPLLRDHTRVKAVQDAHEPGSVMKTLTVAIAMEANKELRQKGEKPIFDPEEKRPTSNPHFKGRKNLTDTHFHSFLNMDMAVQKSSNIYVARLVEQIVERLGNDWYKKRLHETYGLGEKCGLQLPSETRGLVPTPGKKHPNGALEWSLATPYSLAMGHNIQMSSLQLVRVSAVFANGGYLVTPTLIRKVVRGNEVLLDNTKWPEFPRVMDPDIVERVVQSMKYTTKTGGTARRADVYGFTEAGKTGTAEKVIDGKYSKTLHVSTFVGFTPVKNAAFVLAVTLDEPEHKYEPGVGKIHMGGTCSASIFRDISRRSLEYLGIPPDDPHGYPVGDPRYDAEKADWLPETRKLQEMYEKWNNSTNETKKTP